MYIVYCESCRASQHCALIRMTEVGYLYQGKCGHQIAVIVTTALYSSDAKEKEGEEMTETKNISDERVRILDKRIYRLVGERHFQLSYLGVPFRMFANRTWVFITLCLALSVLIQVGYALSQGLLTDGLVVIAAGISLAIVCVWLIQVVRALWALRELRMTIYPKDRAAKSE